MVPLGSLLFSKGKQRSSESRRERGWEERRKRREGRKGRARWGVLYERRVKKKKASVACVYLSGLTS